MALSYTFNFPEEDRAAFEALLTLDEPAFESLVSTIASTKPTLSLKGAVDQLKALSSLGFKFEALPSVARVVIGLGRQIYEDDLVPNEIVSRLATFAAHEGWISNKNQLEDLQVRLLRLLAIESVQLSSKAFAVLSSQPYAYAGSKIFTEIRPLFANDEVLQKPSASVLAHQLRFETMHDGEKKELYIALDDSDLKLLKDVIERAMKKSAILREQELQIGRFVIAE